MLLASTNCVGAFWCKCIILLAPLIFFWNPIRYEREGRFRAINVILHRGCAAETDRSDNFSIHFDGKSATPRRHILIHHRLVSLVLGLNSHAYSLWVAVTPTVLPSSSRVQKESRMFNEELRVHVVRAVIGVGVDDQLRIRHVLLHDEREHRGYVHVVTDIYDECWLLDRLQIVVGSLLLDAPFPHRFDLGGRHFVVHLGIAAFLPKMRALQELPSRRLACRGRTEFEREPDILGRIGGGGQA